jgi:hypothetical protein
MNVNVEKILNKLNDINYNEDLQHEEIIVYTNTNDIMHGYIQEYGINRQSFCQDIGYLKLKCNGLDCTIDMQIIENIELYNKKEINNISDSRFFNPKDIKPLNYKDLNGKTLKMTVVDNDECLLVAGIDKENNKIYMLHSKVR